MAQSQSTGLNSVSTAAAGGVGCIRANKCSAAAILTSTRTGMGCCAVHRVSVDFPSHRAIEKERQKLAMISRQQPCW